MNEQIKQVNRPAHLSILRPDHSPSFVERVLGFLEGYPQTADAAASKKSRQ